MIIFLTTVINNKIQWHLKKEKAETQKASHPEQ